MNFIFRFFFKILGWKIEGRVPIELKKGIFVVAPHNSTKDFFVGLGLRAAMKMDIGYLGKAELFKPPFGFIFRWLGGTPVYRSEKNNLVESYVNAINSKEKMLFALAPEGTRGDVQKLKTGFYYIAEGAKIPIVLVGFDLPLKTCVFSEPFFVSRDFEKDTKEIIVPFFEKISGFRKSWIENYKNNKF